MNMTDITYDPEIAFTGSENYPPVASKGIITALGFDWKIALKEAPQKLSSQKPLFQGMTQLWGTDDFFLAGPVIGAPMAVMAIEEMRRRGAKEVIFLGLAGSLKPTLQIGDVILPQKTISSEGTSAHYPAPPEPSTELMRRSRDIGLPPSGCIWSTDAIYRETASLVTRQKEAGASMVDMEISALYAAAAFRGLDLAALVVISDIVGAGDHQTGFHMPEFKQGMKKAAQYAWRIIG